MSEQLHPTSFETGDHFAARPAKNKDEHLDVHSSEENEQLEKSFDHLAAVLKDADWEEPSIQLFAQAVFVGSTDLTIDPLVARLKANLPYVTLRPAERLLWEQWSAGMSLDELRAEYRDDEHYSIHKLRLQIAAVVAKIAAQTF